MRTKSDASSFLGEDQMTQTPIIKAWKDDGSLGHIIVKLQRENHLSTSQVRAGLRLINDMKRGCARTGSSVLSSYGERIRSGQSNGHMMPLDGDLDSFARCVWILDRLREHERQTLEWCLDVGDRGGSLAMLGEERSGYVSQKTAKAWAAGQVAMLLHTIEELYNECPHR